MMTKKGIALLHPFNPAGSDATTPAQAATSLALLIWLLVVTLLNSGSVLAEPAPDQISGTVVGPGSGGIVVSLEAWGAAPLPNVIEFVPVSNVRTDDAGRFSFSVPRSLGQHDTSAARISFRGWAVRAMLTACGPLTLRPPAMRLRDNCEAGWLIRPWQAGALDASAAVTFATTTAAPSQAAPSSPAPVLTSAAPTTLTAPTAPVNPQATPTQQVSPTPALPTALPIAAPPSATPAQASADNGDNVSQLPSTPIAPSALPIDPPAPTSPITTDPPPATATPTDAATLVPFIIDSQPPLSAPTVPAGAGIDPAPPPANPTATSGLVIAQAPPQLPAAPVASATPNAEFDLVEAIEIGVIALIALAILARFVNWLRKRTRTQPGYALNPTDPALTGSAEPYGSVENTPAGAAFHLPPPGATYRANLPTQAVPLDIGGQMPPGNNRPV